VAQKQNGSSDDILLSQLQRAQTIFFQEAIDAGLRSAGKALLRPGSRVTVDGGI
jgi:hypothetical protein